MSRKIALNARFYSHRPTGMQRYAHEVARRMGGVLETIQPRRPMRGSEGHVWEQLYLPAACAGRALWSPNTTGPLAITRQVCTIHDLIVLDHPEWFSRQFAQWYRWLLPRLAPRLRHIIAVSEFTKQRIVHLLGVDPAKVSVVYNGVDARYSPRPALEVGEMRRDLKLPPGDYLLCVGSIEPRKNIGRLLEAWRLVESKLGQTHLVITGALGSRNVFPGMRLGELPKRVLLTGYVEEAQLPALYSGAMGFIYPSLYEGFGLPPLEAMACGVPVIASTASSLPEVVGPSALFIDPVDVTALAAAIRRLVDEPALRLTMRAEGFKRAGLFSWDTAAQKTKELLTRSLI